MLFDAIINLFKTICIGVIAFSPLLFYKALDEPFSGTGITVSESALSYPIEQGGGDRPQQEENSDSTNQTASIFSQGANLFSQNFSPPPPPPPPVDAPIDYGLFLLIPIGMYFGYRRINKSRSEKKLVVYSHDSRVIEV